VTMKTERSLAELFANDPERAEALAVAARGL
jgi:hypothetical protein